MALALWQAEALARVGRALEILCARAEGER